MAYIGKQGISSTTLTSKTLSTMVGNGSTDTLTLSPAPDSVNDVAIYLDGVFQTPGTEYTLAGSTITFTTAPANNVFVCALVGGGEHIGTPMDNSIGTDKLVDGTLTNVKIDAVSTSKVSGTLPALNANAVTGLNAANLVGSAMPAIDGSNLTGISSFTKNANDPATNTNGTLGDIWANTTSGELYVLTDATTNANVWTNVGDGTGEQPFSYTVATGGTITTDGNFKVHTFNASGTFEVTTAGTTPQVEYLVIAGGGGGAAQTNDQGAGGGAGGYRNSYSSESSGGGGSSETELTVTATTYTVTVGAGGGTGSGGGDSTFSSITSVGGGAAGAYNTVGGTGGSGAGGSANQVGGAGTANQGFAGGTGQSSDATGRAGGGGGAGAVGVNGPVGTGGAGLSSSITGSVVTRAGGGGGADWNLAGSASGGTGGGGSGGGNGIVGGAGTVNTGSGGGGHGTSNTGGSGVVIIRYQFQQ